MITEKAPLSSSLLMMERELPSYLSTAYSLKYGNEPSQTGDGFFTKIHTTIKRYFSLIKELYSYRPRKSDFIKNIQKLDNDFQKINESIKNNTKPICAYFVSSHDSNGAIIGDHLYPYHHYKIKNFEKHYAVAPKVVRSQSEMKDFLAKLKACNPERKIEVIDIVAHGGKSTLCINEPTRADAEEQTFVNPSNLTDAGFKDCAEDATIILDACSTGFGHHNIADEIARKNPGKTVFAPGPPLFFSKPVISHATGAPKMASAVHGFAILNAHTFKKFHYKQSQPTQLPYTKDENLLDDTLKLLELPILNSSSLDTILDRQSQIEKNKVLKIFNSLSKETQTLIKHQVWKNHKEPLNRGEDFGGDFLKANPLHETTLSAFRTVGSDIKKDQLNPDFSYSRLIKAISWTRNVIHTLKARLKQLGKSLSRV